LISAVCKARIFYGLGSRNLVGPSHTFVAATVHIRPQEVGALEELGPGIERGVVGNTEAETCRAAIRLQDNDEAGGALVALENAVDLSVQLRLIDPFLGGRDAGGQTFKCRLDALTEPVMDCPNFAAPIRRPTEDYGLRSMRRFCQGSNFGPATSAGSVVGILTGSGRGCGV